MSEVKDFRAVNPKYDQDWINGVGESEHQALFKFLEDKKIKTILDLAGGSGKLTKMFLDRGYDVFLFDIADNMIEEARNIGVPLENSMSGDIFINDIGRKFDCVIFKSAMHEIPAEKSEQLHKVIYGLLNEEGWFIDWDVHVPTEEDSMWFKKWVNLKDSVAGLHDLVKNRNFYTENFISESLKSIGFKNVGIAHRFFYTLSTLKMNKMYWDNDEVKSKEFFDNTKELIKTISSNIIANEISPYDIELKVPAIIIVGQK